MFPCLPESTGMHWLAMLLAKLSLATKRYAFAMASTETGFRGATVTSATLHCASLSSSLPQVLFRLNGTRSNCIDSDVRSNINCVSHKGSNETYLNRRFARAIWRTMWYSEASSFAPKDDCRQILFLCCKVSNPAQPLTTGQKSAVDIHVQDLSPVCKRHIN